MGIESIIRLWQIGTSLLKRLTISLLRLLIDGRPVGVGLPLHETYRHKGITTEIQLRARCPHIICLSGFNLEGISDEGFCRHDERTVLQTNDRFHIADIFILPRSYHRFLIGFEIIVVNTFGITTLPSLVKIKSLARWVIIVITAQVSLGHIVPVW